MASCFVQEALKRPASNYTCNINLKYPFMKLSLILCLVSAFAFQSCIAQPVTWFSGCGRGITRLSPALYNGKRLTHTGDMMISLVGLDIPLHHNLRPVISATLSFSNAYLHSTQIPAYDRSILESYSIHLHSITTEVSFLYHIINRKLKFYGGAGANYHYSWSNSSNYKMEYTRTGTILNYRDDLDLEREWVSLNVKAGLTLRRWRLGVTGDVKGIISVSNFETLQADLYYLWIGFRINKEK
jgi:hypothetical protein